MKYPFIIAFISVLLMPVMGIAQEEASSEATVKAKNYVFTDQERDSLQLWFYDRATVMGLKDEKRDEFYSIVLDYLGKARALLNKETGDAPKVVQEKFEQLLTEQHEQVKAILDEEQYNYYLDTYSKLVKSFYERKGWE